MSANQKRTLLCISLLLAGVLLQFSGMSGIGAVACFCVAIATASAGFLRREFSLAPEPSRDAIDALQATPEPSPAHESRAAEFIELSERGLRELLAKVATFGKLLEDDYADKLDARGLSIVRATIRAGRRTEHLLSSLAEFAAFDHAEVQLGPVESEHCCRRAAQRLEQLIAQRNAAVTFGELPRVVADDSWLTEVFVQLIDNALKYCNVDPVVRIEAHNDGAAVRFEISDNGIGIERGHRQNIFEPLERGEGDAGDQGAGFGLALCRKIIERFSGRIWVKPNPQTGGSIFCFRVPGPCEKPPAPKSEFEPVRRETGARLVN